MTCHGTCLFNLTSAAVCAAILGCAPPTPPEGEVVVVRGTVTNAGQPLKVARADVGAGWVQVVFWKDVGKGVTADSNQTYSTKADDSGAFEMKGRFGNGIPPGKYRIAVRQWDPYPDRDRLEGKFSEKETPIVRDVDGKTPIDIDLSKP